MTTPLKAGTQYIFLVNYYEGVVGAQAKVWWSSDSLPMDIIRSTYFLDPSIKTAGDAKSVMVKETSIPKLSTIEKFSTTHIAGKLYTMTIQSRDANGILLDS